MTEQMKGRRVAILVANEGVEQVELTEPWKALEAAGAEVSLLAPELSPVQAFNHLDKAQTFEVTRTVDAADPADFAMLVLPGGVANPDQLRTYPTATRFVTAFFDAGKPVAAICHAPWTLVEADVVRGRNVTSWPSLQTDLRNAGATWVDQAVVVDESGPNVLITSRKPDDISAFNEAIIAACADQATAAS